MHINDPKSYKQSFTTSIQCEGAEANIHSMIRIWRIRHWGVPNNYDFHLRKNKTNEYITLDGPVRHDSDVQTTLWSRFRDGPIDDAGIIQLIERKMALLPL